MTKDEIKDIVEAILVSNMEYAERIADQFMGAMKSGIFAQGLQFECEASEIRDLLRRRASTLRDRADVTERSIPSAIAADYAGMLTSSIVALRASADRLDWHASHLVEKRYSLSVHDVEMLMPSEPIPPMSFSYDPARGVS